MKKMTNNYTKYLLAIIFPVLCAVFSSCQQIDLGSDPSDGSVGNDDKYSVKITSKSGETGVDIPSPLTVCAVDEDGLVASKTNVAEGESTGTLSLKSGDYTLYAVAGTDVGTSDIAEKNTISATNGWFSTPIMQGKRSLTIEDDDEAATLSLSYAVASVDVTLSEIPDDIETITVEVGTQYETMSVEGEYTGTCKATFPCTKQSDGTWKSAVVYVFPGVSSNTVITVKHTSGSGVESSYSITYGAALVAGTPYHFKGTYKKLDKTMSITCNVTAEGWGTPVETSFDFGEGANDAQAPAVEGDIFYVTAIPAAGTALDGHVLAYVDTETNTGLLYSKKEWDKLGVNNEALQAIAEAYSENEITDWSIPTMEQMEKVKANYESLSAAYQVINGVLADALVSGTTIGKFSYIKDKWYLCVDGKYNFYSGNIVPLSDTDASSSSFYLRLVKPITFVIQ